MKFSSKRKWIIGILLVFIVLIGAILIIPNTQPAKAETMTSNDNLVFTLISDEDGESSYSVSVKPASRPVVEFIVVPETYGGLPVTEVASNGFVSCANLEKVILPATVKVIGNNAFMNCANLKFVSMPNVQSIGSNAFGFCVSIDRLFIPNSVTEVGSNILRNNANTVYIQSSVEVVSVLWSSTWSNYFTGEIVYSADPEDTIQYREVLSTDNQTVIGYEITEQQFLADINADIIIYNCVCVDEELGYLPLLNICPEAFTCSQVNSITIRDRHTDYPEVPSFSHKINIRSNAFFFVIAEEINIEVGVTFNHPENLQLVLPENDYVFQPIVGDSDGYSTRVFEEAYVKSITLPADIDIITERMFFNCSYLNSIKISGEEYDGENVLPEVNRIGAEAFSSCVGLANITVPDSVNYVGEAAFSNLGENVVEQIINIEMYEDEIPSGWDSDWAKDNQSNVQIVYKPLVAVTIVSTTNVSVQINVKPEHVMPQITIMFLNPGYIFDGIYSSAEDGGFQYYNSNMQAARVWNNGDPEILYVKWVLAEYTITYTNLLDGTNNPLNPIKYTVESPAITFANPTGRTGYSGTWDIPSIAAGSTGDKVITAVWEAIEYTITYENLLGGTNSSSNPTTYTIESPAITFVNPTGRTGYTGTWDISGIAAGSTGNKVITAVWEAIEYTITYETELKGQTNPNPATYTIEDEITLIPLEADGYTFEWSISKIEEGTTGNLTVSGTWALLDYNIQYNVDLKGLENPNLTIYDVEDEITFVNLVKEGYTFAWSPARIEKGTTGDITVTGTWTPIEYSITYVVWSGTINSNPSTYNIDNIVTFAPAVLDGYIVVWDRTSTEGCMGNITVTATYYSTDALANCFNRTTNRYELYTTTQLDLLRTVDTTNKTYYVNVNYGNATWTPIENFYGSLTGSVTGIKLVVNDDSLYYGFIKINNGTITDFTLDGNLTVSRTHTSNFSRDVGLLCGYNNGTISGCTVKSSNTISYVINGSTYNLGILNVIDKNTYIGGVVGYNGSTVTNCTNYLNIYGYCNIGGVVGQSSGKIVGCTNNGTIRYNSPNFVSGGRIGGIVGFASMSNIENCKNYGAIWFMNPNTCDSVSYRVSMGTIAGEVDRQSGTSVVNCYNYGSIYTAALSGAQLNNVGGLVGYTYDED